MIESYINSVVEFTCNSRKYMCVIASVSLDNRAVCFRVISSINKKKTDEQFVAIDDNAGKKTDFLIDYRSRFYLPNNRFDKVMFKCSADDVAVAAARYSKLPLLSELVDNYNKLYAQIRQLSPKDSKDKRKALNRLADEINARKCIFLFLENKGVEKNKKYRNYRIVPDKNGISSVYQGGGCSGK